MASTGHPRNAMSAHASRPTTSGKRAEPAPRSVWPERRVRQNGRSTMAEMPVRAEPKPVLIWARPERRLRLQPRSLSRKQIVRAALEVADAEGAAAVSMRRVAAPLRAGTMSLYWYVSAKQDLLDLMVDAVLGEIEPLQQPP